jgi:formylglycine-generating enzyme required for sulfatase activity
VAEARGVGKLFISYRRDDTQDITGRLFERLAARFGDHNIFMDVDSIPIGADFRQILRDAIADSSVALVMIGRQWLTVADERGKRRLDNPNDFVRIEVEAALARGIPVVPILTQGAAAPHERDLPPSMAALAFRHGVDVRSDQHFGPDAEQLIARLAPLLEPKPVYPLPDVPPRLASLGFRGVNLTGTPAIIPPLVSVAAGRFLMGSDKGRDPQAYDEESPQDWIEVAAFQLGKYPVTVAEYALAVNAKAMREPPTLKAIELGGVKYPGLTWQVQLQRLDHPVVAVSWQDANAYITWLRTVTREEGWRLPTEAEWEKAARWDAQHNSSRIYPWGESFDKERCNTSKSGHQTTTPVGSYPASDARRSGASPCGAEDMEGNVWEWTSSLYTPYPYTVTDGREAPDSIENRTLRGGSWGSYARLARAASRIHDRPDGLGHYSGFRLALSRGLAGS